MGCVYEAHDLGTRERVAVKVLHSSSLQKGDRAISRFHREAAALRSIDTEHIVDVRASGMDPATGAPYMVMEYLDGEDLEQLLRRVGALHPDAALRIAAQACVGLQRAHEAGVIHRDIKPANVFLARRGGGEITVKILDFGVAKIKADPWLGSRTTGITRTGSLVGSPLYMSPEQAEGVQTTDERTDIWSLGVVLYAALAGRAPYADIPGIGRLLVMIVSEPPPPVQRFAPWVPDEVAAVVRGALQIDVAARFQSAAAMLDALRPLLRGGVALREEMLAPFTGAGCATGAGRTAATRAGARSEVDSTLTFDGPASPIDLARWQAHGGRARAAGDDAFRGCSACAEHPEGPVR